MYIHMESMQDVLMNLKFNGKEVTPNLNKLSKEGMFFSNYYSPVSTGTSSDAEYMLLTGLLPSASGTVFVTYSENTFHSLPINLKERNYYTFSMQGNYSARWNRYHVHPRIGYKDMYFRDSYEFSDSDVIGLGINDKLFFKQAVNKLETIEDENKNYFGTIITLTNHSSFEPNEAFTYDIKDYFDNTETCYLCDKTIGKYIVSSHYADEALGDFINYINKSDHFKNTLFVFYGDHDAKISYKEMLYLYNYDKVTGELKDESSEDYKEYDIYDYNLQKKVPLIFWTKNKTLAKKLSGEVSYTMAAYDVVPTLNNMLNIKDKYVLGHDIFNIKNNNIVIFPNGNFVSDKVYYNNSTGEYKPLKDDPLQANYVTDNAEYAEHILEVANSIINYDLFNEKKENE